MRAICRVNGWRTPRRARNAECEAYAAKAKALARMRKFAEALKAIEKAIEVTNYKPERFVKIREQIQGQDKVGK